jgi:hypothetical protein
LLFSTEREVPTRPEDVDGAKAEAEPARRAVARAANFTIFNTLSWMCPVSNVRFLRLQSEEKKDRDDPMFNRAQYRA